MYRYHYNTPENFSDMWMTGEGDALTGLWFEGSRDRFKHDISCEERLIPIFEDTIRWLDEYFRGSIPDFTPKYRIDRITPFRQRVIEKMLAIPYGETVTYGDIAGAIADETGIAKMSAQAVGGAVGWNPICVIIPCHRVVGSDRSLTGYGGGIVNKIELLKLETGDISTFIVPTKGTAL